MEHIKKYFDNLISNSPLITIPVVTGFGYLFGYQYEAGTAKYYHIPDYLIQIEPLQVIYNAITSSIILALIGLLMYLIAFDLIPKYLRVAEKPVKTQKDGIIIRIVTVILAILLSTIIPYLLGERNGGKEKSYILFQNNNKHYAIVRIYGDSMIAVEFDTKKRILKKDILILPKDQSINGTVEFINDIREGK